ncbi:MAG: hypothetical protein U9O94_10195 [Nanoarchaeota archaeon]|nr:hypothetical protein [Nanoarchaeota archaeon]
MADDETIDNKAENQTPRGKGSIFDELGSSLESLVNSVKELPGMIKETVSATYYTAKMGTALAAGSLLGLITSPIGYVYPIIFGTGVSLGKYISNKINKIETKFKDTANEFSGGAIMGGALSLVFTGIHYIGNFVGNLYGPIIGKATKIGAAIYNVRPAVKFHEFTNRALNKEHKPIVGEEMEKQISTSRKYLWPTIALNFGLFGQVWQNLCVAVANSTIYGGIRGYYSNLTKKDNKQALQPA